MNVTKAVVLAHTRREPGLWARLGIGARFLVPLGNRPVLVHHVEALARAGVRDIALVIDRETGQGIHRAIGDGAAWGVRIQYVELREPLEACGLLGIVETLLDREPFVMQEGDVLVHDRMEPLSARFASQHLDALALELSSTAAVGRPGPRLASVDGRSTTLPDVVGACFVHPRALADLGDDASGDAVGDVVATLTASGSRVDRARVSGCVPCGGDHAELLAANRAVLSSVQSSTEGAEIVKSELQGPVSVAPGAQLNRTIVRGPAVIGPHAVLNHAYVGPYTSIGSGALLESAEVEHSIVLDDAELRHIETRIESSIIGRGARVTRDLAMPRAMRLVLADGADVRLA
jgi:glucose-1-phosphate thymidylyltransferase